MSARVASLTSVCIKMKSLVLHAGCTATVSVAFDHGSVCSPPEQHAAAVECRAGFDWGPMTPDPRASGTLSLGL